MTKIYKSEGTSYREIKDILQAAEVSRRPVIFFNVQTTGLDPYKDEIIQIGAVKCDVVNGELVPKMKLNRYVQPEQPLSEEIIRLTGITPEILMNHNATPLDLVFPDIQRFFGSRPILAGYNCTDFSALFLQQAGFNTGYPVLPVAYIDILKMVKSIYPVYKTVRTHSFRNVAEYMGIFKENHLHDAVSDALTYVVMFDRLFKELPVGMETAVIENMRYWNKVKKAERLYINTNRGKLSVTEDGFYHEDTAGIFSIIDLNQLTEQVLKKFQADDIRTLMSNLVKNNSSK